MCSPTFFLFVDISYNLMIFLWGVEGIPDSFVSIHMYCDVAVINRGQCVFALSVGSAVLGAAVYIILNSQLISNVFVKGKI